MTGRNVLVLVGTAFIVVTLGIAVAGHEYGHALDILLASWIALIIGVILRQQGLLPLRSRSEIEHKNDLPPGAVVWIGSRIGAKMAVKRAGQTDEGYAWRWVDTGELVDYDTVYKAHWTLTDPHELTEGRP